MRGGWGGEGLGVDLGHGLGVRLILSIDKILLDLLLVFDKLKIHTGCAGESLGSACRSMCRYFLDFYFLTL